MFLKLIFYFIIGSMPNMPPGGNMNPSFNTMQQQAQLGAPVQNQNPNANNPQ